jgi:hypothetical protein
VGHFDVVAVEPSIRNEDDDDVDDDDDDDDEDDEDDIVRSTQPVTRSTTGADAYSYTSVPVNT